MRFNGTLGVFAVGFFFSLFFPVLLSLFFPGLALSSSGVITWEMEEEAEVFPCKEQMLE